MKKLFFITFLLLNSVSVFAHLAPACEQSMELAETLCGEERARNEFSMPEYTMIEVVAQAHNNFGPWPEERQLARINSAKAVARLRCRGVIGEFEVVRRAGDQGHNLVVAPCFTQPAARAE